jgi:hypothetical protein
MQVKLSIITFILFKCSSFRYLIPATGYEAERVPEDEAVDIMVNRVAEDGLLVESE